MKTYSRSLAALALVLLLAAGCGTLDPQGAYQGDTVLYQADLAIVSSYDALHQFVTWEFQNRATLSATNPRITVAADDIRRQAPAWFASAIALRDAYALNKTGANRDALMTTLNVLRSATSEATKYLVAQNFSALPQVSK